MAVFLSTFENKVDRKGRVSVPAPFRAALGSSTLVLYPSPRLACIEGCGEARLERIVESIDALEAWSDEAEALQTLLADAHSLVVDRDGRIVLPPSLREYAGIGESAVFVGAGRSFRVWNPGTHAPHRERGLSERRERGITLAMARPGGGVS